MRLFVGNLSFKTEHRDLVDLFADFGATDVKIITDRESGRSRGFAFVECPDDKQARAAIDELDGQDFMGRNLNVNQARPREGESNGHRPGCRESSKRRQPQGRAK